MKSFYRLLNEEFNAIFYGLLAICAAALFVPPLLIAYRMKRFMSEYERYEQIYATSGSVLVFVLCLAALLGLLLYSVYSGYWRTKSVYTMLTLPVSRESLFFGKLAAFGIGFLLLWLAALLNVWLGCEIAENRMLRHTDGSVVPIHNGLFLAVIRSDFMNLLIPFTVKGLLSTVSMAAALITGVYYGALCERSRRYWGVVPIAVSWWLIYRAAVYRIGLPEPYVDPYNLWLNSAILLALTGWFAAHGIILLKKGATV